MPNETAVPESTSTVSVEIKKFDDIWGLPYKVVLPSFQRAYVWQEKNLRKLLHDFLDFAKTEQSEYYMGTILLYKNQHKHEQNSCFEVIDGQQRLTTLVILKSILSHSETLTIPENCAFEFQSQISQNNIIRAKQILASHTQNETLKQTLNEVFGKLRFTLVITDSQDDAFSFFDTQNSRGVQLRAIDLLKAHHLRVIRSYDKQSVVAKKWESIEYEPSLIVPNEKNKLLDELFQYILYRARAWRGTNVEIPANKLLQREGLQAEFGDKTLAISEIQMYPHRNNTYVRSIDIDDDGSYIAEYRWKDYKHTPHNLPFSLRQPINKGIGYFLFVEKYALILKHLTNHEDNKLLEFDGLYQNVVSHLSGYLRQFYMLCMVCYYDKFEDKDLFKFALWLEFIVGSLRWRNDRIVEQTIPKYLREQPINLIDMILGAYTPDQLLQDMQPYINEAKSLYENQPSDIKDKPVKQRYAEKVFEYYGQSKGGKPDAPSIGDKYRWVNDKIGVLK